MINTAILDEKHTATFAVYCAQPIDVLRTLKDASMDLSIYSAPAVAQDGVVYAAMLGEIHRATKPGRLSVVRCADVRGLDRGYECFHDEPGEIIRLHQRAGFLLAMPRVFIWKEPITERQARGIRAMEHRVLTRNTTQMEVAGSDYLLVFRRPGEAAPMVEHPRWLMNYAGERKVPIEYLRFRGWDGRQCDNLYSQWIWQQYISSVWDDIRGSTGKRKVTGTFPPPADHAETDGARLTPIQADAITRAVELWSNPGDTVLFPFLGGGTEACAAIAAGRLAFGIESLANYYAEAVKNLEATVEQMKGGAPIELPLFDGIEGPIDEPA